jgi:hypothetical protein
VEHGDVIRPPLGVRPDPLVRRQLRRVGRNSRQRWALVAVVMAVFAALGSSSSASEDFGPAGRAASLPIVEAEPQDDWRSGVQLDEVWMGDLDGIGERGRLRVLTTYSMTNSVNDIRPFGWSSLRGTSQGLGPWGVFRNGRKKQAIHGRSRAGDPPPNADGRIPVAPWADGAAHP